MMQKYTEVVHDFGGADHGDPPPGVIQIFLKEGLPYMVDFLCPCGCGARCPTHLLQPGEAADGSDWAKHCWGFSRGPGGGVTLSPSIRYRSGCKAHFNITDGEVIM